MAEKFAFQKVGRQGGATHGNELLITSIALFMDRPGDKFLARTAFSEDKHNRLCRSDPLDDRTQIPDFRAFANDLSAKRGFIKVFFKDLPVELGDLVCNGPFDLYDEFAQLVWFSDIFKGPQLHRFNGALYGGVARKNNDFGNDFFRTYVSEQRDAVHAGHYDVKQDNVVKIFPHPLQGRFAISRHVNMVSGPRQLIAQQKPERSFIVNDKDFPFFVHSDLPSSLWNFQRNGGAFAHLTGNIDGPVAFLHYMMTDGETKPDALSNFFCRKKRIKHLGHDVGGNARAIVGNGQPDILVVVFDRNRHGAPLTAKVKTVRDDMYNDLFKFMQVGAGDE